MEKKYVTQKELEKELNISAYTIYQYARRGLRQSKSNPGMYNLEKSRKWISEYKNRENQRELNKAKTIKALTSDESEIIIKPAWNAKYAILYYNDDKRQSLAIKRALYLMVQYSTSHSNNMVYISQTPTEAKDIKTIISKEIGVAANDFLSLTMPTLAREILTSEGFDSKTLSDEIAVNKALELLENNEELQEKYGYIYRQFFVEKLELLTTYELQLLHLLLNYYGEGMFNVSLSKLSKDPKLIRWLKNMEDIYLFENEDV